MTGHRTESRQGLSTAVDRLSSHAAQWGFERVMDEGLDLVRDSTWADGSVLHAVQGDRVIEVARRPVVTTTTDPQLPLSWFPWGLAPVNPQRFLLVDDASSLPARPDSTVTLGQLGVRSCLHLPILERQAPVGALHLYWSEPRLEWDDDRGRLLRSLGRFLLAQSSAL